MNQISSAQNIMVSIKKCVALVFTGNFEFEVYLSLKLDNQEYVILIADCSDLQDCLLRCTWLII